MQTLTRFCAAAAAACTLLLAPLVAGAADPYPARTVTLLVPYPPGGTIDALARDFAEHLRTRWSATVIIDNRVGGNGIVGVEHVKRSPPDGYTLLVATNSSHSIGPATDPEMKYDPVNDFSPIALFGETPLVLTAGPTLGNLDFRQVLARGRGKSDGVTYGSVGMSTRLVAHMIEKASGARLLHVNYKQFGPALLDITRGNVDMGVSTLSIVQSQIQRKVLRPLAVTSRERSKLLPDVPTVAEFYPGFEVTTWFGLFGPANLPDALRQAINREMAAWQRTPGRSDKWAAQALTLRSQSPAEFGAFVKADYARWRALAAETGLKGGGK